MYKKNKLGIKVYDENTILIDGIYWDWNGIAIEKSIILNTYSINRYILSNEYGFKIKKRIKVI